MTRADVLHVGAWPDVGLATPFVIVLNAGSGRDDSAATRATIERVLREAGRAHELLLIERGTPVSQVAARAVERARAMQGTVIAAGGEGAMTPAAEDAVARE